MLYIKALTIASTASIINLCGVHALPQAISARQEQAEPASIKEYLCWTRTQLSPQNCARWEKEWSDATATNDTDNERTIVVDACRHISDNGRICIRITSSTEPVFPPSPSAEASSPSLAPSKLFQQAGIAPNCTHYDEVVENDDCQSFLKRHGTLVAEDFHKWNPAIGANCENLLPGFTVCVGMNPVV